MAAVNDSIFPTRKLSYTEYGHCLAGTSKYSGRKPLENTIVIEGRGELPLDIVQQAVNEAAKTNPSVRLKLEGSRQHARWIDSGRAPVVRMAENCTWDGYSSTGSEFIYETCLSAMDGAIAEFIIAKTNGPAVFLIFRSLHAAMDGLGCIHFIEEVFRALNHRELMGSDIFISNTDLMRQVTATPFVVDSSKSIANLTGAPSNISIKETRTSTQYLWRRFAFEGAPVWLLAKVAAAINTHCQQRASTRGDNSTVRIAVPVNLRRHAAGRRTTLNYAAMAYIDMEAGDGLATFNKKLHILVAKNSEACYRKRLEIRRYIPMPWLDFFLSSTAKTAHKIYKKRRRFETIAVSDLGILSADHLSTDSFTAAHLYAIPLAGSILCIISTLDKTINITLGMPEADGSDGRFEDFVRHMKTILITSD